VFKLSCDFRVWAAGCHSRFTCLTQPNAPLDISEFTHAPRDAVWTAR
jgi:hypothetical protein